MNWLTTSESKYFRQRTAQTGSGTQTVAYTYTNGNGCSNTASQSITARGRTTHSIYLSGFANGIYILRIQSAAGVSGAKLVKE